MRSLAQESTVPSHEGFLKLISVHVEDNGFTEPDARYWERTIGNTILVSGNTKMEVGSWVSVREDLQKRMIPNARLNFAEVSNWDSQAVERRGTAEANELAKIWYS